MMTAPQKRCARAGAPGLLVAVAFIAVAGCSPPTRTPDPDLGPEPGFVITEGDNDFDTSSVSWLPVSWMPSPLSPASLTTAESSSRREAFAASGRSSTSAATMPAAPAIRRTPRAASGQLSLTWIKSGFKV
mgnify:CR=1 FL=1